MALDERLYNSIQAEQEEIDPITGLPRKKKLNEALAQQPQGIGPVADPDQYAAMLNGQTKTEDIPPEDFSLKSKLSNSAEPVMPEKPVAANVPEQNDGRRAAYELYDKARERNEMLDLAQILGQAVTQYGAAQSGLRTGRDMSGINMPRVDYERRSDRSMTELQSRLRDIKDKEENAARRGEKEEERKYKEAYLRLAEKNAAKERSDPTDRLERAEELRSQREDAKSLKDRLAAGNKVIAIQQAIDSGNISKKTKESLEKNLVEEAGKAGIDLGLAEADATEKGLIWNSVNKGKRLSNIKAQLEQLAGRRQAAPAPQQAQAPAGQPAPQSGTVRIKAPDGSIATVDASKVQKYLDKGGVIVK